MSLRTVHIVDWLNIGGAQSQLLVFAEEAAARQIEMTVVSLGQDQDRTMEEKLRNAGASVVHIAAARLLSLSRFIRLVGFLKKSRFEIVHTHLTYANILGTLAAKISGIPMVASLHSTGDGKFAGRAGWRERLEMLVLNLFAKKVMAVGNRVFRQHQTFIRAEKMMVVLNGTRNHPVSSSTLRLRQQILASDDAVMFIALGRLAPPKGYDHLLNAFAAVVSQTQNAKLLVVGDGQLWDEISAQVVQLGLDEHVFLLGSRNDAPDLLAASDVFVLSSTWEGLPMALLEGMMAGLAIVATDVGDVRAVVPENAGIIVPPGQPQALTAAMLQMLVSQNARKEMGKNARQFALKHFTSDVWFEKTLAIYRQVLSL